jgi:hypothetical protein
MLLWNGQKLRLKIARTMMLLLASDIGKLEPQQLLPQMT